MKTPSQTLLALSSATLLLSGCLDSAAAQKPNDPERYEAFNGDEVKQMYSYEQRAEDLVASTRGYLFTCHALVGFDLEVASAYGAGVKVLQCVPSDADQKKDSARVYFDGKGDIVNDVWF